MSESRTGAIIEARIGSSRLPGKVLREVVPGWTLLDLVVGRARRARRLDSVVVATSTNGHDDVIVDHCTARGIPVFRGSEDDVLGRILAAAADQRLTHQLRLTGDNPLIDGRLIDDLIGFYRDGGFDYAATTMMGHSENWRAERTFPRGVSVEVFGAGVLRAIDPLVADPLHRESPTFHIYDHPADWRLGAFAAEGDYAGWRHPDLRLTVDTPEDLELARRVFARLGGDDPTAFGTGEAIALVAGDAALRALNAGVAHRVMSEMTGTQSNP